MANSPEQKFAVPSFCCICTEPTDNVAGFCGCQSRVAYDNEACTDCLAGKHDNALPGTKEYAQIEARLRA